MTGGVKTDNILFEQNLEKAKYIAQSSAVSSISITGKGEPFLNIEAMTKVVNVFKHMPIEVQTNGRLLKKLFNSKMIGKYNYLISQLSYIDVFAFSCDTFEEITDLKDVIENLNRHGFITRITFNVTDRVSDKTYSDFLNAFKEVGVRQFSFRKIIKANFTEENEVHKWIDEHGGADIYDNLISQGKGYITENNCQMIRKLSYGAVLYDVDGMSYTYFDYCIQDTSDDGDVRSLIYQEDGHLYTTWNSPASLVF
jgi:molybdenum cofactor biosynthesis enzyme MoaA